MNSSATQPSPSPRAKLRLRFRFSKTGDLRLVSHNDLMRCLERMLRRTGLPVAASQGFNPRPKIRLTLALALGVAGDGEVLELDLSEPFDPIEAMARLNATAPAGLSFHEVEVGPAGRPSPARSMGYRCSIAAEQREGVDLALQAFLGAERWPITRTNRQGQTATLDLREHVLEAGWADPVTLQFRLKVDAKRSAKPEEFLAALGVDDLLDRGLPLIRTDIELAPVAPPQDPRGSASPTPQSDETGVNEGYAVPRPNIRGQSQSRPGDGNHRPRS